MKPSTRASVQERAGHRCEYCQLHQEDSPLAVMHVEHIIPRIHGGLGLNDLAQVLQVIGSRPLVGGPNLADDPRCIGPDLAVGVADGVYVLTDLNRVHVGQWQEGNSL